MCAAFGSALGKEKIKMKKEDVKTKHYILYLYNIAYLCGYCC